MSESPVKIGIEFEEKGFLQRFADLKGIPMTKILRNAGRDFIQAAMRTVPVSTVGFYDGKYVRRPEGQHYTHAFFNQWNEPPYTGRRDVKYTSPQERWEKNKMLTLVRRGYSKFSWAAAGKKLGMSLHGHWKYTTPLSTSKWDSEAQAHDNYEMTENNDICLTITNTVGWHDPKYSGINSKLLDAGMSLAAERIVKEWNRMQMKF